MIRKLISDLKSRDFKKRNNAALKLRDIEDSSAVPHLLNAIKNKNNFGHTGTLVYALQTMDCSNCFHDLINIALYGNYENQCMAMQILNDQFFNINKSDVHLAKIKLKDVKNDTIEPKDMKSFVNEMKGILKNIKMNISPNVAVNRG